VDSVTQGHVPFMSQLASVKIILQYKFRVKYIFCSWPGGPGEKRFPPLWNQTGALRVL
jgi:hypothetical protein